VLQKSATKISATVMILLTLLSLLSLSICFPTDEMGPPTKKPKIDVTISVPIVHHVPHLYPPAIHQIPTQYRQPTAAYTEEPYHKPLGPPKYRKTPIMKEIRALQRIVAIGEINSNYNDLVLVLQSLGIINNNLDWKAENIFLVQLGNSIGNGRNPDDVHSTFQVMSLWEKLIPEARQHNSEVILLLGPNEFDTISGNVFRI
jgi:hypothetical protein